MTIYTPPQNIGYSLSQRILYRKIQTPFYAYLAFSDYWCEPDHIERGVKFLKSHPDYVMYASNYFFEYQNGVRYPHYPQDMPSFSLEKGQASEDPLAWASVSVMYRNFWTEELLNEMDSMAGDRRGHFSDADAFANFYAMHIGRSYFDNFLSAVYVQGEGISSGNSSKIDIGIEGTYTYLNLLRFEERFLHSNSMRGILLERSVMAYISLVDGVAENLKKLEARDIKVSRGTSMTLSLESEDIINRLFHYILQVHDDLQSYGIRINL